MTTFDREYAMANFLDSARSGEPAALRAAHRIVMACTPDESSIARAIIDSGVLNAGELQSTTVTEQGAV